MKVRYTVEIDVENDWDELAMRSTSSDIGDGRKQVVGSFLRRAISQGTMVAVQPLMMNNGMVIGSLAVSEPQWDGWDNARIAKEIGVET